jgi:hypothetical protein
VSAEARYAAKPAEAVVVSPVASAVVSAVGTTHDALVLHVPPHAHVTVAVQRVVRQGGKVKVKYKGGKVDFTGVR